jgi:type I restriction enzyme S subunit
MIEEVKLSTLITLQRGFDITKKEQSEGDIPVISSGGIGSYHNKHKVEGPGVVVGRKGTLGTVFYTKENYWPHDTSLWVKDFKGNNPKFIYYLLKILHFEKFDAGAANPTLNRNHVHSLKIQVPLKQYRYKIASILSAYDDLIENNNQRIKLLEAIAEEIYKEWFVRMRFPATANSPGWKESKFFDTEGKEVPHGTKGALPEGWELVGVFDLSEITYGYPFQSSQFTNENVGNPVIRIRDIKKNFSKTFSPEIADEKYWVNNGDMLVGMDGDFHVGKWAGNKAYLNQRVVRFKPKAGVSKYFIYWSFKKEIDFYNQVISGTTVAHLSDKDIKKIIIPVPGKPIMNMFKELVDPLFDLEIQLKVKNQLLQETRDLLLPRLISGKLSVEKLNMANTEAPLPAPNG